MCLGRIESNSHKKKRHKTLWPYWKFHHFKFKLHIRKTFYFTRKKQNFPINFYCFRTALQLLQENSIKIDNLISKLRQIEFNWKMKLEILKKIIDTI